MSLNIRPSNSFQETGPEGAKKNEVLGGQYPHDSIQVVSIISFDILRIYRM